MSDLIIYDPPQTEIARVVEIIYQAHPDREKIPANVAMAAALLALQAGANPNPIVGELWIYEIAYKWTPTLGVAYYRRKANENGCPLLWAPMDVDGRTRTGEPRPMTTSERDSYNVPATAKAAICRGYRLDVYRQLLAAGVPWDAAINMCAQNGIAFLLESETKRKNGDPKDAPRGRSYQWVCEKRAEVDLYRKLGVVASSPYAIDTPERHMVTQAQQPAIIDAQPYTLAQANAELF